MMRLASILYSIISATLAGSLVVAALVSGNDTLYPILIAAGLGFVLALPATWVVARALYGNS